MTKKTSRLLVIDASVLQSAGESEHPVSSACRETLNAVLRICHHAAITEDIRAEWRRHRSRFARKWEVSMVARRKAPVIAPAQVPFSGRSLSAADRAAVKKDLPLLQAGLAADGIIVTRDEALKRVLVKTRDGKGILKRLRWINPTREGAAALESL